MQKHRREIVKNPVRNRSRVDAFGKNSDMKCKVDPKEDENQSCCQQRIYPTSLFEGNQDVLATVRPSYSCSSIFRFVRKSALLLQ